MRSEQLLSRIVFGRKAGGLIGYVATFDVDLKLQCLASLRSQCRAIRSHLSLYTVLKLSITIEVEMKLETAYELSGKGHVFARRIHMASQIPIRAVDASRGGSCLETRIPMDVLEATDTPEVKAKLAEWDKKTAEFDPQKDLQDTWQRIRL